MIDRIDNIWRAALMGGLLLTAAVACDSGDKQSSEVVAPAEASIATEEVTFSEDIFPVIRVRCMGCHVPGAEGFEASGLDLSSYEGLMAGTNFGPMVMPGNPDASNLLTLIDGQAAIRMPHNEKPMSKCERQDFRNWVAQGALDN